MAEKVAKRVRKANFSAEEVKILLEEIQVENVTLFSSHSATITNEMKKEIWQRITSKVNACGVAVRTVIDLKEKWKVLKASVLNKKRDEAKTRGGPATAPVPYEEVILSIIGDKSNLLSGVTDTHESGEGEEHYEQTSKRRTRSSSPPVGMLEQSSMPEDFVIADCDTQPPLQTSHLPIENDTCSGDEHLNNDGNLNNTDVLKKDAAKEVKIPNLSLMPNENGLVQPQTRPECLFNPSKCFIDGIESPHGYSIHDNSNSDDTLCPIIEKNEENIFHPSTSLINENSKDYINADEIQEEDVDSLNMLEVQPIDRDVVSFCMGRLEGKLELGNDKESTMKKHISEKLSKFEYREGAQGDEGNKLQDTNETDQPSLNSGSFDNVTKNDIIANTDGTEIERSRHLLFDISNNVKHSFANSDDKMFSSQTVRLAFQPPAKRNDEIRNKTNNEKNIVGHEISETRHGKSSPNTNSPATSTEKDEKQQPFSLINPMDHILNDDTSLLVHNDLTYSELFIKHSGHSIEANSSFDCQNQELHMNKIDDIVKNDPHSITSLNMSASTISAAPSLGMTIPSKNNIVSDTKGVTSSDKENIIFSPSHCVLNSPESKGGMNHDENSITSKINTSKKETTPVIGCTQGFCFSSQHSSQHSNHDDEDGKMYKLKLPTSQTTIKTLILSQEESTCDNSQAQPEEADCLSSCTQDFNEESHAASKASLTNSQGCVASFSLSHAPQGDLVFTKSTHDEVGITITKTSAPAVDKLNANASVVASDYSALHDRERNEVRPFGIDNDTCPEHSLEAHKNIDKIAITITPRLFGSHDVINSARVEDSSLIRGKPAKPENGLVRDALIDNKRFGQTTLWKDATDLNDNVFNIIRKCDKQQNPNLDKEEVGETLNTETITDKVPLENGNDERTKMKPMACTATIDSSAKINSTSQVTTTKTYDFLGSDSILDKMVEKDGNVSEKTSDDLLFDIFHTPKDLIKSPDTNTIAPPTSVPKESRELSRNLPSVNVTKNTELIPSNSDDGLDMLMMMMTDSQLCQGNRDTSKKDEIMSELEQQREFEDRRNESNKHVDRKKEEGKSLVKIVLDELVVINRQLLRLKRDMDVAKRKLMSSNCSATTSTTANNNISNNNNNNNNNNNTHTHATSSTAANANFPQRGKLGNRGQQQHVSSMFKKMVNNFSNK